MQSENNTAPKESEPVQPDPAVIVKPNPKNKRAGPRLYTPDELDLIDKQGRHTADRTLADVKLKEVQERGIQSPDADGPAGHINSLFLNHRAVQSPRHHLRRLIVGGIVAVAVVYWLFTLISAGSGL